MACAESAYILLSLILHAFMPGSVPGGTIMLNKKYWCCVRVCFVGAVCALCVRCVWAVCVDFVSAL